MSGNSGMISALGLSRKAGKLVYGFDAVAVEVKSPKRKIVGVMLASDLSPKSAKEMLFLCEQHKINVIQLSVTMDDIAVVMGRRTGILAHLDVGLFKLIIKNNQQLTDNPTGLTADIKREDMEEISNESEI